jgi:hypothetical protein
VPHAAVALMSRRYVQAIVLLLTLVVFSIPNFVSSLNRAGELDPAWSSAAIWVKSAECARTTKAVLVLCREGRLVPIADVSAGDDPGPALALSAYAALTGAVMVENDVSRVNTILNYIGIGALAVLLFSLRLPVLALLVLSVGSLIANQFHSLMPHPGHLGVACLVALLPLAILGIPLASSSRRLLWLWVIIGVVGLAIGMVFREAIGLMGVLAGLLALGASYFCGIMKLRYPALVYIAIAGGTVLTIWTPFAILRARDAVLHIAPSDRMEQHGAWHNLYIGLGVVENPFGIEWNDDYGVATVKKVSPTTKYLSAEYYAILRHEYFQIVRHHPLQVAAVYLNKLVKALKTYTMWLLLVAVAVIFTCLRVTLSRLSPGWTTPDAVFAVSAIFVAAFLGQAFLFNYVEFYLFPIKMFLLLSSGVLVELLLALGTAVRSVAAR